MAVSAILDKLENNQAVCREYRTLPYGMFTYLRKLCRSEYRLDALATLYRAHVLHLWQEYGGALADMAASGAATA
jgi:hypothetical protein